MPANQEVQSLHERFPLTKTERARINEVSVLYRGWGQHEKRDKFLRRHPHVSDLDREMVEQTGFSGGYRVDADVDVLTPEFQRFQVDIATGLVAEAARARRWNKVDFLVLSSLSFQPEYTENVKAQLWLKHRIRVDTILFYGQACNGLIAGVTDACRRPEMRGKQVVVTGMENLSGSSIDHSDLKLAWTFGNGAAAIAFRPGIEIQHLAGKTVVERDEKGVIGLPPAYGLPQPKRRLPSPPWYEVRENARGHFVSSVYGICMAMFPSVKAFMNGRQTFAYFARRVPPVVGDILQYYWSELSQYYGELGPGWAHQASKPVLTGLQKKLDELAIEHGHPAPVFPWMMEATGFNNVSSATAGIALTEMIQQKLIVPGRPFPVMGYGIGSVIEGDILLIPETRAAAVRRKFLPRRVAEQPLTAAVATASLGQPPNSAILGSLR